MPDSPEEKPRRAEEGERAAALRAASKSSDPIAVATVFGLVYVGDQVARVAEALEKLRPRGVENV